MKTSKMSEHARQVVAVARKFIQLLKRDLTKVEYRQVLSRNARELDPNICHSHDFTDANMTMCEAIADVLNIDEDEVVDRAGDGDLNKTWNSAWTLAKTLMERERAKR